MKEIWNYIIALLIIAIIRWILPKFEMLVIWLINKLVKLMEKLIKGSKLGEKKKKLTLKILRICGIKSTEAISQLVDIAVDTMNSKQSDITSNIKDDVSNKIGTGVDKLIK